MNKIIPGILILLLMATAGYCQEFKPHSSPPSDVFFRIRDGQSSEKLIAKVNLISIKKFIIKQGRRQTYSQIYNYNPYYETTNYYFYLNPDIGQTNIDCALDKSDFNTLVINQKSGGNRWGRIDFRDNKYVKADVEPLSNARVDGLTVVADARGYVSQAISEILIEMAEKKDVIHHLPHMMKGYELYSWKEGNEWYFSLLPGTNHVKTYGEITKGLTPYSFDQFPVVRGIAALKVKLAGLPKNEDVIWSDQMVLGFNMPSEQVIKDIEKYCKDFEIKLEGASK